ncbi:hypothetical protein [Bacillus altitudinis]|uniref:hypothetical protein n=1 Tax=Bacillus altitudinis TaxID=293387 RepID=UPI00227EBB45|nr:hypothetical protein [Bacillus altitudinis]MCY7580127.1 hypothetical protein [Bacillus altitudinis]MCY7596583.1 hypothetical protein [Bacillus altitudinis]
MTKSFKDIEGNVVRIDRDNMDIDTNAVQDVVSGKISSHEVNVDGRYYEVSEEVHDAVKEYVKYG